MENANNQKLMKTLMQVKGFVKDKDLVEIMRLGGIDISRKVAIKMMKTPDSYGNRTDGGEDHLFKTMTDRDYEAFCKGLPIWLLQRKHDT